MMLYGPDGRLLESGLTATDPGLAGGWLPSVGGLSPNGVTTGNYASFALSRPVQRRAARIAYLTNPLLYGAIEVIHSFVLGTGVTVGEITDKRAAEAVADFWEENHLDTLLNRMFTEYLLDGESLPVWPTGPNLSKDQPAHIALVDVDRGLDLELDAFDSTQVTGVKVANGYGQELHFGPGQFRFHAHDSLWNDPRGWPVVMRAVPACLQYTGFLERRLRLHDIQSRINGVYKAFAKTFAEQQQKASAFQRIPSDGSILTLAKDSTSGQSEEFDFVTQKIGAADAATDARLIRLLVAVALNLPEHYLGEAGDANLATASAMNYPARKGFERKQRWVENWLNDVMATELERRYGPGQLYTITETKLSPTGMGRVVTRRKVTARKLKFPWSFPSLDDESIADLVAKIQAAAQLKLADVSTLSGELGYDYAAESELMSARQATSPPPPPAPPQPNPTPTPPEPVPGANSSGKE
jgi:hypothetical protein